MTALSTNIGGVPHYLVAISRRKGLKDSNGHDANVVLDTAEEGAAQWGLIDGSDGHVVLQHADPTSRGNREQVHPSYGKPPYEGQRMNCSYDSKKKGVGPRQFNRVNTADGGFHLTQDGFYLGVHEGYPVMTSTPTTWFEGPAPSPSPSPSPFPPLNLNPNPSPISGTGHPIIISFLGEQLLGVITTSLEL